MAKKTNAHRPKTLRARAHHAPMDDGRAFVSDPRDGFVELPDGDAEALGEEFIAAATSAEAIGEDARDEVSTDELDGLHVTCAVDDEPDDLLAVERV